MRERDEDFERYINYLADCFTKDEVFTLQVGQSCRVKDEHVGDIPQHAGRFKLMYKRVDETNYQWLDTEGEQGVDVGPIEFFTKHWEIVRACIE